MIQNRDEDIRALQLEILAAVAPTLTKHLGDVHPDDEHLAAWRRVADKTVERTGASIEKDTKRGLKHKIGESMWQRLKPYVHAISEDSSYMFYLERRVTEARLPSKEKRECVNCIKGVKQQIARSYLEKMCQEEPQLEELDALSVVGRSFAFSISEYKTEFGERRRNKIEPIYSPKEPDVTLREIQEFGRIAIEDLPKHVKGG